MNKLFTGIMPAMITPIDAAGRLKAKSAEAIMKLELDAGVNGFKLTALRAKGCSSAKPPGAK